ncbi:MAG: type II secretion system GspH family protein, partial [Candidatus Yonathbacteria bacterium]|nr:type II secretion system GspH family protein [Candidatus Yonathbacteria bacterium]
MFTRKQKAQRGFGVVEIIVGASVISIALFGLVSTFQNSLRISRETGRIIEARFLTEEGLEAMRIMRDGGWSNVGSLATSTPLYLVFSGGTWATTTTQTFINRTFLRSVVVEDVRRDG